MALEDVVVGVELDPRDIRFDEASGMFQIVLGSGMARDGAGVWSIDPASLAAIIAPLIDAAAIAPLVAPLIPPSAGGDGSRVVSHGFDPGNKTFSSSLADGTQVVAGLPDVLLATELAGRLRPLTSVSGRPVPNAMVLSA